MTSFETDAGAVASPFFNPNQEQYESLASILQTAIQRTYHQLMIMMETFPHMSNTEKKIKILAYACRTRQLFMRIYALVKFIKTAHINVSNILSFLDQQSFIFVNTADNLYHLANVKLVNARLPSFSILSSVDVLTLGTYPRLPSCIKDRILPSEKITEDEKEKTVKTLNRIIQCRLALSELPSQFKNFHIENGFVDFEVRNEFEIKLTLVSDNFNLPWRLLKINFLVKDARDPNKVLINNFQVNQIHQYLQEKLNENDRPFVEIYKSLHFFSNHHHKMDNSFKQQKIDEVQQNLIQLSTDTFKHCMDLWSQIGYSKQEILNRCNEITVHFNQVYDDLIYTESEVLKQIQVKLDSYKHEVKNLQKKLNVNLVKLNDSNNNPDGLDSVDFRPNTADSIKKTTMFQEMDYYKKMIDQLSQIKSMRSEKLGELRKKEKILCEILNRSECSIFESSCIDQSQLDLLEERVKDLSFEKNSRVDQLKVFCTEISNLIKQYKLRVDPNSSLYTLVELRSLDAGQLEEKILNEKINLDPPQLDKYRSSLKKLTLKKDELINSIDLLRSEILNLWSKFELKNSDLEDLILNPTAYNQETYDFLFDEYNRCCKLKQARIKLLINEKYEEIAHLTNFCLIDQNVKLDLERKTFEYGYTEEVLEEHQTYLDFVRDYAIKYESFFNNLKEWTDLWQQFKDFEKAHMDPKRFHQRGYSSLAEQRERDSFKNKLSKLRLQLNAEADRYAKQEGRDLLIHGKRLADFIESLKRDFDKEKENMREERKSGVNLLRKKSVVRNFLTPQNQNVRSVSNHKSLLTAQSPSPAASKHLSAKLSNRDSAKLPKNSIREGLNFDLTPNSSRIAKSTPRKILDNANLNDRKKSTSAQVTQKNKRRSSIKELSEKYKKNQRRSKIPFEGKTLKQGVIIPEIIVNNGGGDFLENENDSILKFSNFCNGESVHFTSSGVMSGFSSSSGISQGVQS